MTDLIRLVYASRSTSTPSLQQQGLDRDIGRILAKSRRNNARLRVVGGLLFGHGNFLQCLEGESEVVENLYRRIESDPRHRDVTLLSRRRVETLSFGAWSMKFAPAESALAELLRAWDMPRFDPYALSPQRVDAAVRYMIEGDETLADTTPAGPDEPVASAPKQRPAAGVARPIGVAAQARVGRTAVPRRRGSKTWLVGLLALVLAAAFAAWLMR